MESVELTLGKTKQKVTKSELIYMAATAFMLSWYYKLDKNSSPESDIHTLTVVKGRIPINGQSSLHSSSLLKAYVHLA